MKIDINKVELKLTDTDDPIASQIKWTPVRGGGANYKTSTLEELELNKIKIKPSWRIYLFASFFVGSGLFAFFDGLFASSGLWVIVSLIIIVVPLKFISRDFKEIYIDKVGGLIYEKKNFIFKKFNSSPLLSENINNIHAIQVIGEHISNSSSSGGSSNYKSFEINLVFKDLRRVCIMDHGKHSSLIEDAKKISTFLNIPIWDAT